MGLTIEMEEMNISNYVIVRADPNDNIGRPFWVARVIDKYGPDHPHYGKVKVIWYVPHSNSTTAYGHGAFYEETITKRDSSNQRSGRKRFANSDTIECSTIHFCFTTLLKNGHLPRPVKDRINSEPSIDWSSSAETRTTRIAKRNIDKVRRTNKKRNKV